jgi:hypothetical protein
MTTKKKARRELEADFVKALRDVLADSDTPMAPRRYVDLMTSSSRDLGRAFRAMLLDAQWDRNHGSAR